MINIINSKNKFYFIFRFCFKNVPLLMQRDTHILSIHNITSCNEDKNTPLIIQKILILIPIIIILVDIVIKFFQQKKKEILI